HVRVGGVDREVGLERAQVRIAGGEWVELDRLVEHEDDLAAGRRRAELGRHEGQRQRRGAHRIDHEGGIAGGAGGGKGGRGGVAQEGGIAVGAGGVKGGGRGVPGDVVDGDRVGDAEDEVTGGEAHRAVGEVALDAGELEVVVVVPHLAGHARRHVDRVGDER